MLIKAEQHYYTYKNSYVLNNVCKDLGLSANNLFTKSLLDKIHKSWYNKRVIRTADKVINTEIGELYESECYELEKSKGYTRN